MSNEFCKFSQTKHEKKIGEKITWLSLISLSLSLCIPLLVWPARQSLLFLMPLPNCPSNIATWRELHYSYMQKAFSLWRFSSFTSSSKRLAAESNEGLAAPDNCQKSSGPDGDPSCQMQIWAKASTSVADANGDAKASAGRFHLAYVAKTVESPSKSSHRFNSSTTTMCGTCPAAIIKQIPWGHLDIFC